MEHLFLSTVQAAHFLIERGQAVNDRDWFDLSPLHYAVKHDVELVDLLIQSGADIDVADHEDHKTPLYIAAELGNANIVRYLLGRGADPQISDLFGDTPRDVAREKGFDEIESIFMEFSAN